METKNDDIKMMLRILSSKLDNINTRLANVETQMVTKDCLSIAMNSVDKRFTYVKNEFVNDQEEDEEEEIVFEHTEEIPTDMAPKIGNECKEEFFLATHGDASCGIIPSISFLFLHATTMGSITSALVAKIIFCLNKAVTALFARKVFDPGTQDKFFPSGSGRGGSVAG